MILTGILYKKYRVKPEKDLSVLVVGTSADYPPYEFIDTKTGELVGFDIDVIREIAHRLHKKLLVKNLSFTSLVFSLLAGDIDLIASGMSPSPRRAKFVHFTDKYMDGDYYVIVSKKDRFVPKGLQDLVGKEVVVNTGHAAEAFMAKQEGVHLIRLRDVSLGLIAISTGSADAFVSVKSAMQAALQKKTNSEQFAVLELLGIGDDCAFAVERHNQKLVKEINEILAQMKNDGTLAQLKNKWNL